MVVPVMIVQTDLPRIVVDNEESEHPGSSLCDPVHASPRAGASRVRYRWGNPLPSTAQAAMARAMRPLSVEGRDAPPFYQIFCLSRNRRSNQKQKPESKGREQ
ncbi:hypothetical protein NL676_005431 [Syzygium grande]|nr:hypothetical protein NL676_005431 [Syzygium grande]